jgi:hypothetical protein
LYFNLNFIQTDIRSKKPKRCEAARWGYRERVCGHVRRRRTDLLRPTSSNVAMAGSEAPAATSREEVASLKLLLARVGIFFGADGCMFFRWA